jgi:hypothetical protein
MYEDRAARPDVDPGLDFMRRYRAIGTAALTQTVEMREQTVAVWQEAEPKLEQLYAEHPSLRPEVRRQLHKADAQFRRLIGLRNEGKGAADSYAGRLIGNALEGKEEAVVGVSVAYAADALLRSGRIRTARDTARRDRPTTIDRVDVGKMVARQLEGDRELLQYGMLLELPAEALAKQGLTRAMLRRADNASWFLTGSRQISTVDGEPIQGPPLHMTTLVADLMNRRESSLSPRSTMGTRARITGKQRLPFTLSDTAYGHRGLVEQYKNYLARRYPDDNVWSGTMANVLAECDLAERIGSLEQRDNRGDLQWLVAIRNRQVFAGVDPSTIRNDKAQAIIRQSQILMRDRHDR